MELRIALPIARIYHARGLTQTQTQTQLMLDGAEPWVARFAARNAAGYAQQLTTAELADRLLAIAEAPRRYPPADVKAAQYEAAIRLRRLS